MSEDLGRPPILEEFIQAFLKTKLEKLEGTASPLLIVGAAGLPLLAVAEYLAQKRFCQSEATPCGNCADCVAFLAGQSTRLKIVQPEGAFIKVEQARQIIEFLSLKKDKANVVIVHQADRLNIQAANALLKTLEEPPENCSWILTSTSVKKILPTIRSRVMVAHIPPLPLELIEKHLEKNDPKSADWIQGRWDRLNDSENYLKEMKEVQAWLNQVSRHESPEPLDWMESREGFLEGIEKIRLLTKDTLLKEPLKNTSSWVSFTDRLDELESACLQNVDRKLLMDHLYMAVERL